ncbi:MAG: tRNA pseudouridine(38-40) synthase TruA [Fimbriimonadaceae bacterium]|nr:tRNA pseudouridine(38-40) synthase TruA [Alphaproteobacteria bacterium]
MPRYKLTIEYDGGPFVGWQAQANGVSVQSVLRDAIQAFCGDSVTVNGAGRTDAGVHARGQVAHIDLNKDWDTDRVRDAINYHLKPDPVAVIDAERVGDDFEARFGATARYYLYRIINRRSPLTLDMGLAWRVPVALDAAAMHAAAQKLVGRHDFTTFRSVECQAKSPVKSLDRLDVQRHDDLIEITASARSFMHHQVRSMVGTLKQAGTGQWTARDVLSALEARDRARCGPVAPAEGLYLMRVDY